MNELTVVEAPPSPRPRRSGSTPALVLLAAVVAAVLVSGAIGLPSFSLVIDDDGVLHGTGLAGLSLLEQGLAGAALIAALLVAAVIVPLALAGVLFAVAVVVVAAVGVPLLAAAAVVVALASPLLVVAWLCWRALR